MHCGIDPGLCKTGWAVADNELKLVASGIVPTEDVPALLQWLTTDKDDELSSQWLIEGCYEKIVRPVSVLWCGKGTGSAALLTYLKEKGFSHRIVDERGTTLEARQVYWSFHNRRGWRRLLPISLQVPPRPLDDLAAYCILRRGLTQQEKNRTEHM